MLCNQLNIPLSKARVNQNCGGPLSGMGQKMANTTPMQTNIPIFPCIDRGKSKVISKMSRHDISLMIRYLTGHAHLRRHDKICGTLKPRAVMNLKPFFHLADPDKKSGGLHDEEIVCRLCQLRGTEETPHHLYSTCLRSWITRRELTGSYSFEREDILEWKPQALLEFFKHID